MDSRTNLEDNAGDFEYHLDSASSILKDLIEKLERRVDQLEVQVERLEQQV